MGHKPDPSAYSPSHLPRADSAKYTMLPREQSDKNGMSWYWTGTYIFPGNAQGLISLHFLCMWQLPQWDEQGSQLFVLPLGLPLIVNIVWLWMHCYQASKVSHLMGTIRTSRNYYPKLPASSLVYSGFLFPRLFLQQQRLKCKTWFSARENCALAACAGAPRGVPRALGKPRPRQQRFPSSDYKPRVTLMCLSFRTTVKHFYVKVMSSHTQLFIMKICNFLFSLLL